MTAAAGAGAADDDDDDEEVDDDAVPTILRGTLPFPFAVMSLLLCFLVAGVGVDRESADAEAALDINIDAARPVAAAVLVDDEAFRIISARLAGAGEAITGASADVADVADTDPAAAAALAMVAPDTEAARCIEDLLVGLGLLAVLPAWKLFWRAKVGLPLPPTPDPGDAAVTLVMLGARSSACRGAGSSKAGLILALVCEECSLLTTLSISCADRLFAEEARSSSPPPTPPTLPPPAPKSGLLLGSMRKDWLRGVEARRSYKVVCSFSVITLLDLEAGEGLAQAGSCSSGDLAMIDCEFSRWKMLFSPDTLPPPPPPPPALPSGEPMKLPRIPAMLLEASGICGAKVCPRRSFSIFTCASRSFSARFASASWFNRTCTGAPSLSLRRLIRNAIGT